MIRFIKIIIILIIKIITCSPSVSPPARPLSSSHIGDTCGIGSTGTCIITVMMMMIIRMTMMTKVIRMMKMTLLVPALLAPLSGSLKRDDDDDEESFKIPKMD